MKTAWFLLGWRRQKIGWMGQGVPIGEIRDSNYLKIGHQIPSISHKFRLISSCHQRINRHQSSLRCFAKIKLLIKDNVKRQNNLCMNYLWLLLPQSCTRSLRRMGVGWRFINQFFKFSVLPSAFLIRLILVYNLHQLLYQLSKSSIYMYFCQ